MLTLLPQYYIQYGPISTWVFKLTANRPAKLDCADRLPILRGEALIPSIDPPLNHPTLVIKVLVLSSFAAQNKPTFPSYTIICSGRQSGKSAVHS